MPLLLIMFFFSGAAALIYEVLWLKDLSRLFGVSAYAASATLAAFFLGIALGSYFWGKKVSSIRNPLRLYAYLELGIAASALLYFAIFAVYRFVYRGLYEEIGNSDVIWLTVKFVLAMLILVPPAIFMGGTLPVMGQFLAPRADLLGKRVSLLYAINTFGAALGAFLAGFYLPPLLGFKGSYFVAIFLNLAIAIAAFMLSKNASEVAEDQMSPRRTDHPKSESVIGNRQRVVLLSIAFASGVLMLSLEVLWTHMFAQVLHNSVYSFAVILTVFLVALALGSVLSQRLSRSGFTPFTVLAMLMTASAALIALNPFLFNLLTDNLKVFAPGSGWSSYVLGAFWLGAATMLIPGLVAGSVFPFLMKVSEPFSDESGRTIGRLITYNTVGAIIGSAFAGFVLLSAVGLWNSIKNVALGYSLLGAAVAWFGTDRRSPVLWFPVAIAVAVGLIGYSSLSRIDLDQSSNEKIVSLVEGRHGTVAVVDRGGDLRLRLNNSYLLGTSESAPNLRMQTIVPLAIHAEPKSIFYLGMGTGITASGAIPTSVEKIVITELNPDVIEADQTHYSQYLNGLFQDRRVRIVPEDGRNYLYCTTEKFDLIISDIFLTHWAGAGDLYSLEHYQASAERLTDNGLYVQWLPMFELSEAEFDIIAATMSRVFPQLTLWRRGFSPGITVAALVGHKQKLPLQADSYSRNAIAISSQNGFSTDFWFSNIPFAAYMGNLSSEQVDYSHATINTDDFPVIEYLAPRVERESRGTKSVAILAWQELGRLSGTILDRLPADKDPFLANVNDSLRRQVRAGLAYYRYSVSERLGNVAESQTYLAEYRRILDLN